MQVRLTQLLEQTLLSAGDSPQTLINLFTDWKSGPEDGSYHFGKDAFNRDSRLLRHVHMIPVGVPGDLAKWDAAWGRESKRTSDRFLFYADGGRPYGFLLIFIVNDPGAHGFLDDRANKALLGKFEQIADDFVHFGTVP
jgi:hypothetical protein